jgi:hypothetical protein
MEMCSDVLLRKYNSYNNIQYRVKKIKKKDWMQEEEPACLS